MASDFPRPIVDRALAPRPREDHTVHSIVDLCGYCLEVVTFLVSGGDGYDHLVRRPTHPTCQPYQDLLDSIFTDVKDSDKSFVDLSHPRYEDFDRTPNYLRVWCWGP